jgi:cytochrome c oxidase subunit II
VGLQHVEHWMPRRGVRRSLLAIVVAALALLASGCSGDGERLAMPEPRSAQGEYILDLWQGAWIAALATGAVVWGLIGYVIIRYRRRSDDEIPIQTRYNLPLEIFYTIAPVIMVVVFFTQTVRTQDIVLKDDTPPENIVEVTGQQWSWTFNYGIGEPDQTADNDRSDDVFAYDSYVHEGGTGSYIPQLWLPVDETTRFNLHSPDVIHGFGLPDFLMRMDNIPGRVNHFVIKPTETGTFKGRCYELCGTYHSLMLFEVVVVSREEYEDHLADLQASGNETDLPLLGGEDAYSQAGLGDLSEEEGQP